VDTRKEKVWYCYSSNSLEALVLLPQSRFLEACRLEPLMKKRSKQEIGRGGGGRRSGRHTTSPSSSQQEVQMKMTLKGGVEDT
jgi:hypothetical protein